MLQFFTRSTRKSTPRPRQALRLSVKSLEARDCPSASPITLAVTPLAGQMVQLSGHVTDIDHDADATVQLGGVVWATATPDAQGNYRVVAQASELGTVLAQLVEDGTLTPKVARAQVQSGKPSLKLSSVQYLGQESVLLSGRVTDHDPGSCVVRFSGAVNDQATVLPDGTFSLRVAQASLGTVQATAVDTWGQASGVAKVYITSQAPSLTLSISYVSQRTVLLTGRVTDRDPGSAVVHFTGVVQDSVQVKPDGTFSLQTTALGLGTVQATAVNAWNVQSRPVQVKVTSAAPKITGFRAIEKPDGLWVFQGRVTNADAAGWTITLHGLLSLEGATTTVQSNGLFSLTVHLGANEGGTVTAQATNWWSQESNLLEALVVPA